MPKQKESNNLFWERIKRIYPGVFRIEKGEALCLFCNCVVQSRKLFGVQQHLNTNKHKLAMLNASKTPNINSTSNNYDETRMSEEFKYIDYDFEFSRCLMEANIPLNKMEHPSIKELLEKYSECRQPNLASLQIKVVPKLYRETIKKLQFIARDEYIWVALDFIVDAEQRLIANFIFGILDPNGVGRENCYLLNAMLIDDIDSGNISALFIESLGLLWPLGIQYDKVLVCVTDSNVTKKCFKALEMFPKMLHVTCFAQSFHHVAEYIRTCFDDANSLISNTNLVFLTAPYRRYLLKEKHPDLPLPPNPCVTRWSTWLKAAIYYSDNYNEIKEVINQFDDEDAESIITAKNLFKNSRIKTDLDFIKRNFSVLLKGTERIEQKGLNLQEIMSVLNSVFQSISLIPQKDYIRKLQNVFQKNNGYNCLLEINKALYEDCNDFKQSFVQSLTEEELSLFKYCPVTAYRAEQTFTIYNQLFDSQIRLLKFESLKQNLVLYANKLKL